MRLICIKKSPLLHFCDEDVCDKPEYFIFVGDYSQFYR